MPRVRTRGSRASSGAVRKLAGGFMADGEVKKKGYHHWCTPPEVVVLVHRFFGGPPDLDPWSNPWSTTGARAQFTGPTGNGGDGFEPWHEGPGTFRTIFANPPWK